MTHLLCEQMLPLHWLIDKLFGNGMGIGTLVLLSFCQSTCQATGVHNESHQLLLPWHCACLLQALLQRQRLAAEAVEQEQKEEEFHLQQAQVG